MMDSPSSVKICAVSLAAFSASSHDLSMIIVSSIYPITLCPNDRILANGGFNIFVNMRGPDVSPFGSEQNWKISPFQKNLRYYALLQLAHGNMHHKGQLKP